MNEVGFFCPVVSGVLSSYINNCYVCTNSYRMTLLKYARKARTDLIWP